MASNPHFYLKTPKEEKSSIYMGIKIKDKMFKYYIKGKVIPELFDKITQRAITKGVVFKKYAKENSTILIDNKNLNTLISNLENDTYNVLNDIYKNEKVTTKELLKEKLDSIYDPKVETQKDQSFINYLVKFIDNIENGKFLHNGKMYKKSTVKTYRTFHSVITDYNKKLDFEMVDMSFYNNFIGFLFSRNYSPNSIGKNIKFVKVIMRSAFENGFHNNLVYTHKAFKTLKAAAVDVYLTQSELDKIYALNLKDKPRYDLIRDVFLVGCCIAQRYSDYSRIEKQHIHIDNHSHYLVMETKKTETIVRVPINSMALNILKKYNYVLPKTYESKVNKLIKEICKMAEINEDIETPIYIGGDKEMLTKPKYELVKTHTARRTGATLMYIADIPIIDIMKITGHTKTSNLLKYIKISKEETAKRLSKNSFFQ